MIKDNVTLKGKVTISLDGKIVREVNNLVVTVGKEWIASRMQGVADNVMDHMAIGTGTTTVVVGDTTLDTEVTRQLLDVAGGAVVNRIITFTRTFAADDPNVTAPATTPITEAGIFNGSVTGDMLARVVFPVINKAETATMSISWAITIN